MINTVKWCWRDLTVAIETTKIVRMQQRRGLKQDLPKPLRPGEIGFATDSRQLFIGADTSDDTAATFNKTCVYEKTASAKSIAAGYANSQVIMFTVPHRWYNKGDFDGATTSASWFVNSNVAYSNPGTSTFNTGSVFKTTDTNYTNITTGNNFQSSHITVVKNGTELSPASNPSIIGSSEDFFFNQTGNTVSSSHTLTFRTPPSGGDEIGITYYGNSAVIQALEGKDGLGTGNISLYANIPCFYTYANISTNDYRKISNENILVSPDTGIGYIGLQFKHIQVATDVNITPTAIVNNGSLTLGNLLISRNDEKDTSVNLTVDSANSSIELSPVTEDIYSVSGLYNFTYLSGNASNWIDNKVLEVTSVAGNTLVAAIPSNIASVTRTITAIDDQANMVITASNIDNIELGDTLYFIETPGNTTNLANITTGVVTDITASTNEITVTGNNSVNISGNISDLSFVVYKNNSNTSIVIDSTEHGIPANDSIVLNNTAVFGTSTSVSNVTANSFIVTSLLAVNSSVVANLSLLTFTPIVSNASVEATPTVCIDLSSYSNVSNVSTFINNEDLWFSLNFIPDSNNQVFITNKESKTKNQLWANQGFGFKLHNDSSLTMSTLGLTPGNYDRSNATIKAKMEDWLSLMLADTNINLFSNVFINDEFVGPTNFNGWSLDTDPALGETYFNSRYDANNFSTIVNNLYYESVNPDIKGLMNIKTNIEFLTYEALAAGSASTTFEAPEVVIITNGSHPIIELGANAASGAVNTVFVEYSIKDTYTTNTQSYARVGTLQFIADGDTGQVALVDTFSDVSNNISNGNIVFTGSISSGNVVSITANNSILPSNDMTMKFIRRRWSNTR